MAFTEAQLVAAIDALKTALAKGEKTATYDGRSVTFRSVEELIASIRMFEGELAAIQGTPRPRVWIGSGSKGL